MNYGLKSAARYYLNREPKDLTKAEQIALLVLPKDSKRYDPYDKPKNFRTRFENIVHTLLKEHIITNEEQESISYERMDWNIEHENTLPYVVDFLKTKIADS
jgi:membrane peptidoglycan carboxypeptidase